jgi:hypothetical protein
MLQNPPFASHCDRNPEDALVRRPTPTEGCSNSTTHHITWNETVFSPKTLNPESARQRHAASPRDTAAVRLIERVEPAVAAIIADLGEGRIGSGSGSIIKVPTDRPLPTVELGRTHDLKAGEPILVAGNPGGRGRKPAP